MTIEHILNKLKQGTGKIAYASFLVIVGLEGGYLIEQTEKNIYNLIFPKLFLFSEKFIKFGIYKIVR